MALTFMFIVFNVFTAPFWLADKVPYIMAFLAGVPKLYWLLLLILGKDCYLLAMCAPTYPRIIPTELGEN